MDVGKLFQKSSEQGEVIVPSVKKGAGSPIRPQKTEILNPDVEETVELEEAENEGWPASDETYRPHISGMSPKEYGRHPLSNRFHELLGEIGDLHDRKGADYGSPEDPFLNIRQGHEFGIEPWKNSMSRAGDKMVRIKQFAKTGKLENESVKDSLLDLASYSIIALILLEEENGKVGE